jgi:hypothetical protein
MVEAGAAALPLTHWEAYYVIVGSSAAALTGLQFVIMALIADSDTRTGITEVSAFGTPTVVHFGAVLLISAVISAPFTSLSPPAYLLLAAGGIGLGYATIIWLRARRATRYKPVLEDWIWHVVIPFIAYGTLVGSALALPRHADAALFGVGAAALLLLFDGIHNAWDTVTYVALGQLGHSAPGDQPQMPATPTARAVDPPAAAPAADLR